MGSENLFGRLIFDTLKSLTKSGAREEALEAQMERQAEMAIKRETIMARFDPYAPKEKQAHEVRAIDDIVRDYPDFDFNLAKSSVQTVAEMMALAFKDHPKDYTNFSKLCTDRAVMKIRRMTLEKRYNYYDKDMLSVEITRYNPNEAQPTVMMKTCLILGTEKPMYLFFCYSCFDGAAVCPHCGGVIENAKVTTTCPYCDCAVTSSATEKAWKITDVRRL